MKRLLTILYVCFLSLTVWAKKTDYVYKETTEGNVLEMSWTVEETDKGIVAKSTGKTRTIEEVLSPNFEYEKYVFKSKGDEGDYVIERDGNKIIAKGRTDKGKTKEITYKIESRPWLQSFNYGLRPLLTSDKTEYCFFIINPNDFSKNNLIAKKQNIEELEIEGKKYQAQKVLITLPGFKGMFWSAYAWFDKETHLFLEYEGNEGPNTPTTVITLSSTKDEKTS